VLRRYIICYQPKVDLVLTNLLVLGWR
jgi:hypothetical protein